MATRIITAIPITRAARPFLSDLAGVTLIITAAATLITAMATMVTVTTAITPVGITGVDTTAVDTGDTTRKALQKLRFLDQVRKPKVEIRKKSQVRRPCYRIVRISGFGLLSAFGDSAFGFFAGRSFATRCLIFIESGFRRAEPFQ